jgi:hypothetical protein
MDSLAEYRDIIERILREHASIPYAYGNIARQVVIDRSGDHYMLMSVGWDRGRVHGCVVHVDIIDGKFWIQRDGTEYGIARELEDAGVPKDHIVLAWKSPERRKLTEYAVK